MLSIFYLEIDSALGEKPGLSFFESRVKRATFDEAMSFRNDKVRLTRLLGEAMVWSGLRKLFGMEKEDCRIQRSEHGKPYLEGERLVYFNISHSGTYIVCAFSDAEVGIDIEKIASPRYEVARRFFHPEEVRLLENGKFKNESLFYDIWVVKESFLKYKGTGLTCPLSSFQVNIFPGKALVYEGGHLLTLNIRECPVAEGYKCYVCSPLKDVAAPVRWCLQDL